MHRAIARCGGMIYGYTRILTNKQDISRQIRNMIAFDKHIKIYQEVFTVTKTTARVEFQKLLRKVRAGDTIVFDSVSRMSRNAAEGFALYKQLFEQAQKECDDLAERTRQRLETARLNGKTLGRQPGVRLSTRKSDACKKKMLEHCRAFGGTVSDKDMIMMLDIDKNTFYRYKRELKAEAIRDTS